MSQTELMQVSQPLSKVPTPEQLPHIAINISEYKDFAKKQALFVDKTALLQKLVRHNFVFLSRPRRFGKSLLVSMLQELYENGTKNFEGLAIHDLWQEETYPVLRISFLGKRDPATFETSLCLKLRDALFDAGFHDIYNFMPECNNFEILSSRIVRQVLKDQQVVLLIDEWDDPLSSNLNNRDNYEQITTQLRQFYTWVRESKAFWFVLVTGIGRYQNTSFFTGEFFKDISMEPLYADLVGYTEKNLKKYFAPYITRSAWLNSISEDEMLEQIKLYYDGFCFDQDGLVKVYSPWSINSFFSQLEEYPDRIPCFDSYWMENANAPSALRTYLKQHKPDLNFLKEVKTTGIELSQSYIKASNTFDDIPFVRLMIQTGYMTIKEKLPPNEDKPNIRNYLCNFTNIEVEELYAELILAYFTDNDGFSPDKAFKDAAALLISALKAHDMPTATKAINTMLSMIDYDLWQGQDTEAFYRVLLTLFLQIQINPWLVRQEVPNNIGRSDIEVLLGHDLFVFELKLLHNKPGKKGKAQAEGKQAENNEAQADSNHAQADGIATQAEDLEAHCASEQAAVNNTPTEQAEALAENITDTIQIKAGRADSDEVPARPISLGSKLTAAQKAFDQVIGKRYGTGSFSRTIENWYGVVLLISESDRQVCYWRHFTTNQDLGSGEAQPVSIDNPPREITSDY